MAIFHGTGRKNRAFYCSTRRPVVKLKKKRIIPKQEEWPIIRKFI